MTPSRLEAAPMRAQFRAALYAAAAVSLVFAVGFCTQMPWAEAFWPIHDTPGSYVFIGAIAAAIAASTVWTAYSGDLGAAAAGTVNLVIMLAGIAGSLFAMASGQAAGPPAAAFAWAIGAILVLGLFLWVRRIPIVDTRPIPTPVRWSFWAFAAALAIVGVALLLRVPNVLPWRVLPDASVLFGWIFLGNAAFFLYGAIQARWHAAAGQLLGFLAYDAVLIGPTTAHLFVATPGQLPGTIIYLIVLIYSAFLAIFYAIVHPDTRIER